jgi:hypothetical protein
VNSVTGEPVRRAEVAIVVDGRNDLRGSSPTDGDGRFICRSLPPGRYRLSAIKTGYAPMDYGAARPYMAGLPVLLARGENKTGIDISLPQLGAITGTIRDVDGQPPPQAEIQALRREFPRGKPAWVATGYAHTNAEGRYRMFHLLPGKYLIIAKTYEQGAPPEPGQEQNAAGPRQVFAYYPGTVDRSQAQAVKVMPGEVQSDIDIQLIASRPVTLEVHGDIPAPAPPQPVTDANAAPGEPEAPVFVQLSLVEKRDSGSGLSQYGSGFPAGGQSLFADLPPGRYILSGSATVDGRKLAAREELDLTGGSLNITLHFAPTIDLAGHVRIEGAPATAAAGGRVFLSSGDSSIWQAAESTVRPDGSFLLKDVPPGIWDIGVDPIAKGSYLKSMTLAGEDVLTADMLITPASRGPLEIVISPDGAQIDGKVVNGTARTILAAPQGEMAAVLSFYSLVTVDETGAFQMDTLTPGEYKLYAFEDLEAGAWLDPSFLKAYESRGTPVELKPGDKAEVVLQAISTEVHQ